MSEKKEVTKYQYIVNAKGGIWFNSVLIEYGTIINISKNAAKYLVYADSIDPYQPASSLSSDNEFLILGIL